MKLRMRELDNIISRRNFLEVDDKVNLFINFESIMNSLTRIPDVDKKVVLERNFSNIIIAETLNLVAHYRSFFRNNGLTTRVFVYMTDVMSEKFNLNKYNPDYRSYYNQKYAYNPKYCFLGDNLKDSIIPTTQKICEYLNGVYFISAHNIEGSVTPLVIGESDKSYKNIIITQDIYELQYQYAPEYMTIYINRFKSGPVISDNIRDCLFRAFKDKNISKENEELLMNKSFFLMSLSAKGNKCRSIESIRGFGYITVLKLIQDAIDNGTIKNDTESFDLIKQAIPVEWEDEFYNNYYQMNLDSIYKDLSEKEIFSITKQLIDKFDNNALLKLNSSIFFDNQIRLQDLTM